MSKENACLYWSVIGERSVLGYTHGEARTKSAINNTQASGLGACDAPECGRARRVSWCGLPSDKGVEV